MNITLILVLLILAVSSALGYKKGMTKEITGLISWAVTIFVMSLILMLYTSFNAQETRNTIYTVVILLVVAFVNGIVRIFLRSAKIVSKLPVFHTIDKLLGVAVGAAEGLLIVWLFYILNEGGVFGSFGQQIYSDTSSSKVLSILYEYNYLAKLVNLFK